MFKKVKWTVIVIFAICIFQMFVLIQQNHRLKANVIRMHVVANSDSKMDQQLKLAVKDELVAYLQEEMRHFTNKQQAYDYLIDNTEALCNIAKTKLTALGYQDSVTVSLKKEAFPTRDYETFSLPAGVYDALRVEIGSGAGKNWWCVAFPGLCLPKTQEAFLEEAVEVGFTNSFSQCLSDRETYRIRFYLLEKLGELEIFRFSD